MKRGVLPGSEDHAVAPVARPQNAGGAEVRKLRELSERLLVGSGSLPATSPSIGARARVPPARVGKRAQTAPIAPGVLARTVRVSSISSTSVRQLGITTMLTTHNSVARTTQPGDAISFGEFRLAPGARTLTRNGSPVHLGGRAFDILTALIDRAGQLVSKAELFAIVWPTVFVEESNLRVQLSALRKALGDGRYGARFIINVPGRGYTFVAEAERTSRGGGAASPGSAHPKDRDRGPTSPARVSRRDEIVSDTARSLSRNRPVTVNGTGAIRRLEGDHCQVVPVKGSRRSYLQRTRERRKAPFWRDEPGGQLSADRSATAKSHDGVIGVFNGALRLEERPAGGYVDPRNLESAQADCSRSRRAHPAPTVMQSHKLLLEPPRWSHSMMQ
jgi:DNA-binding winged helix-turn-helix (wHTH) protein